MNEKENFGSASLT